MSFYYTVHGQCGVCNLDSGVACLTATTFAPCFNGSYTFKAFCTCTMHIQLFWFLDVIDTALTRSCPSDQVCGSTSEICDIPSVNFTADCQSTPNQCNVCTDDCRFACLGPTTFAYCFGTMTPSSSTGACPAGTYCDVTVAAPLFCSSNSAVRSFTLIFFFKSNVLCLMNQWFSAKNVCVRSTTIPPITNPKNATAFCQESGFRAGRYATPVSSQCHQ